MGTSLISAPPLRRSKTPHIVSSGQRGSPGNTLHSPGSGRFGGLVLLAKSNREMLSKPRAVRLVKTALVSCKIPSCSWPAGTIFDCSAASRSQISYLKTCIPACTLRRYEDDC